MVTGLALVLFMLYSPFPRLMAGMKITVAHRPKSAHIARLAAHSTQWSVFWPDKRYTHACSNQIITACTKMQESSKWLQALISETRLWNQATARKQSYLKGKCQRRRSSSGNGLTRGASVYGVATCWYGRPRQVRCVDTLVCCLLKVRN